MRKEVNKLDNLTTGKAVDALLNFETVALFNNQVRPRPRPAHAHHLAAAHVSSACC